jgi:hypothetical protein
MKKLELRVIPSAEKSFVWLIVDHVWDGISAPIAIAPNSFQSEIEAQAAGLLELEKIGTDPARDHPLQD